MKTLIIKLNAMGDVVRTTTLLRVLQGEIVWITDPNNLILLSDLEVEIETMAWADRTALSGVHFDLVINLEDDLEVAQFASSVHTDRLFGAYATANSMVAYSEDSKGWFDMSLSSRFGRVEADLLKLHNRRSYQDLVFEGLGHTFRGERYCLPRKRRGSLVGDVALAPVAGPVWPMKGWAHYEALRSRLEESGLTVNVLPRRASILEHIADVENHRCLVVGDSLPMHIALGVGVPCVAIFNCTSPWEIHDYGLLEKIISPALEAHFYKRRLDVSATEAIELSQVLEAVRDKLNQRPA